MEGEALPNPEKWSRVLSTGRGSEVKMQMDHRSSLQISEVQLAVYMEKRHKFVFDRGTSMVEGASMFILALKKGGEFERKKPIFLSGGEKDGCSHVVLAPLGARWYCILSLIKGETIMDSPDIPNSPFLKCEMNVMELANPATLDVMQGVCGTLQSVKSIVSDQNGICKFEDLACTIVKYLDKSLPGAHTYEGGCEMSFMIEMAIESTGEIRFDKERGCPFGTIPLMVFEGFVKPQVRTTQPRPEIAFSVCCK